MKREIVQSIKGPETNRGMRSDRYRVLHRLLKEYREQFSDHLSALENKAEQLRRAAGERSIVEDRTWAFPLHERDVLHRLQTDIRKALALPVDRNVH